MSMSYDDCQDVLKERDREEREDEIRQRLLGPIGQRPQHQPRTPLRELAVKCVTAKAQELLDNVESAIGYTTRHYAVGDPDGRDHYEEGACYVTTTELIGELDDLLDDLKTIEKEGW